MDISHTSFKFIRQKGTGYCAGGRNLAVSGIYIYYHPNRLCRNQFRIILLSILFLLSTKIHPTNKVPIPAIPPATGQPKESGLLRKPMLRPVDWSSELQQPFLGSRRVINARLHRVSKAQPVITTMNLAQQFLHDGLFPVSKLPPSFCRKDTAFSHALSSESGVESSTSLTAVIILMKNRYPAAKPTQF